MSIPPPDPDRYTEEEIWEWQKSGDYKPVCAIATTGPVSYILYVKERGRTRSVHVVAPGITHEPPEDLDGPLYGCWYDDYRGRDPVLTGSDDTQVQAWLHAHFSVQCRLTIIFPFGFQPVYSLAGGRPA